MPIVETKYPLVHSGPLGNLLLIFFLIQLDDLLLRMPMEYDTECLGGIVT